jgi:hypothetical protein
MNGDFISVGNALKLFPYFKGNKQEVLAFIGNVDMAFAVINPVQEDVLYKFVLMRVIGESRTAVSHSNLGNWAALEEFLKNLYIDKRCLIFMPASYLKPNKGRMKKLQSGFRESRPWDYSFMSRPCSTAVMGHEKVH